MENKEINSHFIQKAMAKRWAVNDKVLYSIYGTEETRSFDIEDLAKDQPIAIKGFYTWEIEKGMNTLEAESGVVIKKILLAKNEIALTRKEAIIIKFYFILTCLRTDLIRKQMKSFNLDDDKYYIKMLELINETPKELQELQMKIIFEKYNKYKDDGLLIFTEIEDEIRMVEDEIKKINQKKYNEITRAEKTSKLLSIEFITKSYMNLMLDSKMLFIKFNEGELFLTENNGFDERPNIDSPDIRYALFPISPNMAILFIFNLFILKAHNHLLEKTEIFSFDLNEKNKVIYEKEEEIKLQKEDLKISKTLNSIKFTNRNHISNFKERSKFYTNNDQFTYQIHFESEKIATICNSIALGNCNNSYVIYKSIHDYNNALQWMKKNKVNYFNKEE